MRAGTLRPLHWVAAALTLSALVGCSTTAPGRGDSALGHAGEGTTGEPLSVASNASLNEGTSVSCPPPTMTVRSSAQLKVALEQAKAGDSINLTSGHYLGAFKTSGVGTAAAPIFLCGEPGARIIGRAVSDGYGLHLHGAKFWRVVGITVTNAQKGIVLDNSHDTVLQGVTVESVGQEAVHFRTHSTLNVLRDSTISRTGITDASFGEGVYIGTAESNWCKLTQCGPDRSDGNVVARNTISGTTAESVDVKEGVTNALIIGNTLNAAGMTSANAAVDIKGNRIAIRSNVVTNSPRYGFKTQVVQPGWGSGNRFTGNVVNSRATTEPGAVVLDSGLETKVTCDNVGAGLQPTNASCSPPNP